ncbi:MAG: ATP phosphoribosyltransferase regulatory subunit [Lachnospiraceae bacterium]
MKTAGLKEFQISIGEVNYFKALVEEAGIDTETEENLRTCISNKNPFGAEEMLDTLELPEKLRHAFREFPQLFGGEEILSKARSLTDNPEALKAVERLEQIYEVLKLYGVEEYISFDLSMLTKYRYYTGIIFQGFTYGSGEPVLKGGRYDKLLEHFGVGMPAIGFGVVIEYVMNALARQDIEIPLTDKKEMIIYARDCYAKALALAKEKRASGCFVSLTAWQDGISEEDYRQLADRHAATCCFVCR